ncbi:MAG: murein biosynthesis integral membrane protein MurJ [Pseudomonadota bacterium]
MSKKLLKSSLIVASMTLLSRILGFARDVVFAREFAASAAMDAFLIAFKIPNFMRRLFAEGAFNQAFVPTLGDYKQTRDKSEVKDLIAHVAGTLGGWLLIISIIGVITAPVLIMLFAPGYLLNESQHLNQNSQYELTVSLLRITFPYILFISLVAFAGGILNSYHKFAIPAFTPVILNIVLISSVYFLVPYMDEPVTGLAIGVFIAGLLQLLLQLPFLAQLGLLVRPKWNRCHEGVRQILKLMLPAIFGASIAQINLLLDTVLASLLVSGSISWLYYSDRLMEFPLGILGVALATVILPSLSRDFASKSISEFSATLDKAIRWVVYLGSPAAIGLFFLAAPIVITLFGSDKFQSHDVLMSSYSLKAYSLGLFGFIMVKVLLPGFYARKDTTTPVKIGIRALIVNMLFNLIFVLPWIFMGWDGPHTGLALATSLSAMTNAWLLYSGLRKEQIYCPQAGWKKVWLQVVSANFVMALFLWFATKDINTWQLWGGLEKISTLLVLIIVAAIIYSVMLWILGVNMKQFLKSKNR